MRAEFNAKTQRRKGARPIVMLHPRVLKIQFVKGGSVIGCIWRGAWRPRFRGRITDKMSDARIFYCNGKVENIGRGRIDALNARLGRLGASHGAIPGPCS